MFRNFILFGALCLFPLNCLAGQFFKDYDLPEDLTPNCAAALLADVVNCSPAAARLQRGTYYPLTELSHICTPDCTSSLSDYHGTILSDCATDTWIGLTDQEEPVAMISELIRYTYNLTCLRDNGDTTFCNNAAAAYAAHDDPDAAALPGGMPANGDFGSPVTDPCDDCLVSLLRFQAGSPYFNGLDLQTESIYESKTVECGIVGAPLTTTPLTLFTPTSSGPPATPTCAGDTYTIQPGDTCRSVSLAQSIGTAWLLSDNQLMAGCVDFPTTGTLCLVNTCEVHTVLETDTCESIAALYEITDTQLRSFNPSINAGCDNLAKMLDDLICVGIPGTPYTAPTSVTVPPIIPTTAAPIPTNIAVDTTEHCGRYYEAAEGDYCNLLVLRFGITLEDFVFLNPAINENCTNLFLGESYCVQAVGDINTYPGKVPITSVTRTTMTEDLATALPSVTWTARPFYSQAPLASGTADDCFLYFSGDLFASGNGMSQLNSVCEYAAVIMDVTFEEFSTWNSGLGNISAETCEFDPDLRYCSRYYSGEKPREVPGDESLPLRDGMTTDCVETVEVTENNGFTCQDVLDMYEITITQFFEWNPSVEDDCSGLWLGYQYCVEIEQATTTTTQAATTTTTTIPTPPGPTQPGQPPNCNKWHLVEAGDNCGVVETEHEITHTQFLEWNPAVSSDCLSGFWADTAYCVGVSPPSTTTTTTSTPTPTPSPAPEPNQAGNAVAECYLYEAAQSGDWCALFADRHEISLANLFAWNTVLGSGGEGCATSFWAGYYYCVGVVSA